MRPQDTQQAFDVIAGLTRKSRFDDAKRVNLPNGKELSSRLGDGGCPSAMTVKALG